MRLLPLSQVIVPENRQRQEFDPEALMELTESIRDRGLMQAIVVRGTGESITLVAGERRLRAIGDLYMLGDRLRYNGQAVPEGCVPTVTLGELSELEAEEAELDENLKRKDLTWQEHAAATERLHSLRKRQMEAEVTRADSGIDTGVGEGDTWTVADTALEVRGSSEGYNHDITRKEIIVAKHLHNPEVAKAKSVDEAFKILKRNEQSAKNAALSATVGLTFTADMHTLHRGNCLEVLSDKSFEGKFDVILTDPPYGMGAHEFGDGAGKLSGIEHHYDDSYESWKSLMRDWAQAAWFAAKPKAHAYVFCDFDRFHELKGYMEKVGWYVFRTPIVIYKQNSGRVPLPDRGPRRQYELCLYAIKGEKQTTHIYPDVIISQSDEQMSHGAQKPVMVYQNLLQRSVRPGDEVLDCFAGSGTIFPAAHSLQCKATGIEMNPDYQGMCLKRIADLKLDEQLSMI